jgi:uncharacterized protein (TIGR03905 family)
MNTYTTEGVCSQKINFEVDHGIVKRVEFTNGCPGNLQAIGKLVEGMNVDDVITKLKGINCGDKGTSCADQLAKALEANRA